MKILVTGAAGFIGRHTVEELVKGKYKVVAIDRMFHGDDLPAEMLPIDIAGRGSLNGVIEKGDRVLHLAAVAKFEPAERDPYEAVRTNILGTMNVIQTCIDKGADRIVFSSSGSVYSPTVQVPIREDAPRKPKSIYGLTKKVAENLIFFYGDKLPYIILRYGYVYGAGKDWGAVGAFIRDIQEGRSPVIFGGRQTNDFIYVKDVVEANILALESPHLNQAYNIGSGVPVSIREVCDTCIRVMGSKMKPLIEPARGFDFTAFVYDISKAKTMLGFRPIWGLEEGIRDSIGDKNE